MVFTATKEGQSRHVPINDALHDILAKLASRFAGREVFLDERGRPVKPDRAYRRFKAALAAGEPPKAAAALNQIRLIVTTNLILGLLNAAIGASGQYWT